MPRPAPDEYEETLIQSTILAGQYEVIRKLGEGGMGEVHLAKDLHLNDRLVAIKTLPTLRAASNRAMKQLKREAATMLELTHEHIVRFYHFGDHQGLPFMVMQYIKGQTLDDLLDEKEKLTETELIDLLYPIADALDYAHAKGVVHKDIKPANIFIEGKTGKLYLADFGIARVVKDTISQVTGRDTTAGTLHYMSPEQCRGEWDLTPASDIYSFATVLYECLTGKVPFHTGPVRELILHQEPTPLRGDSTLCTQIMCGLAKSGGDRPATCNAIVRDFSGMPSAAPGTPVAVRARPEMTAGFSSDKELSAPSSAEEMPSDQSHGTRFTNSIGMEFILINPLEVAPEGFLMGSPDDEDARDEDEHQHRVILTKPFFLGITAVTQAQYRAVTGSNPSYFKKKKGGLFGFGGKQIDLDDHPVESVSWNDAMEFFELLPAVEGKWCRLPSEAEWEFACRAGSTNLYCFGNSVGFLGNYAWHNKNSGDKTHAVGQKKPNAWGLYDLYGNVWEWCADRYDMDYYENSPERDPQGPNNGSARVMRGGSWHDSVECRSASRFVSEPDSAGLIFGFRVAMDLN